MLAFRAPESVLKRRDDDATLQSTADYGFAMFSIAARLLRAGRALFRRVFADDGSGSRIDHAHGENFGKAPHGSGQM